MSWSDQEKTELFKCVQDNTVMLARVDERLKSGEKKFVAIESRLNVCEKTTSSIKTLAKTFIILIPIGISAYGLWILIK